MQILELRGDENIARIRTLVEQATEQNVALVVPRVVRHWKETVSTLPC